MARTPPAILAWASWLLAFSSFAILLGGISASQRFCGRSSADSVTISGAAGYFANSGCSTFYRYTWFIVWYQWAMVIIVPIVLSMGAVHKWRYGIIALLLPVTYLLQNTAQSFYIQEKNLTQNKAASRAVLSGAIIGAVANYALIILFGTRQEKERPVET